MNAVFLFVLKSILVSGILTGYYWMALRNKQFHQYNRFYLLFTLYASIHLPLLQVEWLTLYQFEHVVVNAPGRGVEEQVAETAPLAKWKIVVLICSLIVSIFLLSVLIRRIIYILKLKRRYPLDKVDGVSLVYTDLPKAPFSFLNNLFWRGDIPLTSQSGRQVFQHELAHITQKHTYDKLISQLMVCIGWFNPFYWLLQREINMIHEFLADQQAIKGGDTESFARMLLQVHNGGQYLNPGHQFSYSPVSRRLSMIIRSKKTSFPYLRKLVLLPLLFLIVASFTVKKITIEVSKPRFNYFINRNDTIAPRLPAAAQKSQPALGNKLVKKDKASRMSKLPANPVNPVPAAARPKEPALPVRSTENGRSGADKKPPVDAVPPAQPIRIETGGKAPFKYNEQKTGALKIFPNLSGMDMEKSTRNSFKVTAIDMYNKERKSTDRTIVVSKESEHVESVQVWINEYLKKNQRKKHEIDNEAQRQREKEQDKRNDPDRKKRLQKKDVSFDIRNERFQIKDAFLEGGNNFLKTEDDPFRHADELLKVGGEHRKMIGEMKKQTDELWKQRDELWKQRDEPWKQNDKGWDIKNKSKEPS